MLENLNLQKVTFPVFSHMKIKGIDHNKKDKKGRTFKRHLDNEAEDEDETRFSSGDKKRTGQVKIKIDKNIEIKEPERNVSNYSKEDEEKPASIDIII